MKYSILLKCIAKQGARVHMLLLTPEERAFIYSGYYIKCKLHITRQFKQTPKRKEKKNQNIDMDRPDQL
jgi:hypothetical protein